MSPSIATEMEIPDVLPAAVIEDPNPVPGTNNWYTNDGDAGGGNSAAFVGCSDLTQPGFSQSWNF